MRSMKLDLEGKTLYSSAFNEKTGAIVRTVKSWEYGSRIFNHDQWEEIKRRYPQRGYQRQGWSPVPECLDLQLTDRCSFGKTHCKDYCYMASDPKGEHGPVELVSKTILGFKEPPYQIAFGGGEPTQHPQFAHILRITRQLGSVPNYTTNGAALLPEVVEATNECCGGVSMTFHVSTGIEWFAEHFGKLQEALDPRVQLNIHVIADMMAAKAIESLVSAIKPNHPKRPLSLVLLAYYPEVGKGTLERLMTKEVYQNRLPGVLRKAQEAGWRISFSQGLLPYFLSRPWLKVNTDLAVPVEGFFSAYIDRKGRMSPSSFHPPYDTAPTIFAHSSQSLWDRLGVYHGEPRGDACSNCSFQRRCTISSNWHYLTCAFTPHNMNGGPHAQP